MAPSEDPGPSEAGAGLTLSKEVTAKLRGSFCSFVRHAHCREIRKVLSCHYFQGQAWVGAHHAGVRGAEELATPFLAALLFSIFLQGIARLHEPCL